MPTESFPIAPTALSVPLHSYGMLAYQLETSGLRSRTEIAICSEAFTLAEDGDLLRSYFKLDSLISDFGIWNLESEI